MLDQRGFIAMEEELELHIKRPRGVMDKASALVARDCRLETRRVCSICRACFVAGCSRPCCGAFPALLQGAPCPAVGCSVPCCAVFLAKRCWAAKHSQVENCLSRSFLRDSATKSPNQTNKTSKQTQAIKQRRVHGRDGSTRQQSAQTTRTQQISTQTRQQRKQSKTKERKRSAQAREQRAAKPTCFLFLLVCFAFCLRLVCLLALFYLPSGLFLCMCFVCALFVCVACFCCLLSCILRLLAVSSNLDHGLQNTQNWKFAFCGVATPLPALEQASQQTHKQTNN